MPRETVEVSANTLSALTAAARHATATSDEFGEYRRNRVESKCDRAREVLEEAGVWDGE